jgi:hypothetical protein
MTSIEIIPEARDVVQEVRDRARTWARQNQTEGDHQAEIIRDLTIEVCGQTQILTRVFDTEEGIDCMGIAKGLLENTNQALRLKGRVQISAPCEYRLSWE